MIYMAKIKKVYIIIIVILLILGIFLYGLSLYVHSQLKAPSTSSIAYGKPVFNASVISSLVLSYNKDTALVPYALIDYSSSNVISANFTFNVYGENPLSNIYFVESPSMCYDCFDYNDVENGLRYYLSRYGLLEYEKFNTVNLNNINSIPKNSTVIIATGLLPATMMPNSGYPYNESLLSLLMNGDTVIYVGDNFSRSIGTGSIIFQTNPSTMSLLNSYNLYEGNGFSNYSEFYLNRPTFSLANRYYSISYAKSLNGTLVAFANLPTSAWSNASAMARDISLALYDRFWLSELAYGTYNLMNPGNSGSFGLLALQKYITYQNGSSIDNAYPFISIAAYNYTNYTIKSLPFKIYFSVNGTLSMPSTIAETQTIPMLISMNINSSQKQLVIPHIDLYNQNMSYTASIPIGFFNTSTGINIIKYQSFALPSGYYIAVLKDFYNRPYAESLFDLAGININPISLDFKNGTFVFSITSMGLPITNSTYSISLNNGYNTTGFTRNGTIIYKLPKGSVTNYGQQTFEINMFKTSYTYSTSYIKEVLHIPVYYIEFAIVIIVIVILNLVLKAPTRDEYYIDVPNFPPSKKVHVTVQKEDILSLFGKINLHYHWHYMPLTAEEIKSGIGTNIRYNNMPVSITLQNVRIILTQLVNSGDLLNAGSYYAPKKWIEESGYGIDYLTTFRKLRDYCVTAGLLFTDLGAADNADIVLTKNGIQAYLIIYSESGKMKNILIDEEARKYIVFLDEESRLKFIEGLHEAYGEEAQALRIGLANDYIRIIDSDHLDQLVL
jgi:hypothetical protein